MWCFSVSRGAAKCINHTVAKHIFQHVQPLARVRCDDDEECLTDIYTGIKVLLTQNHDKTHEVLNGNLTTVECVHNATIFLTLATGNTVYTYPVTQYTTDGRNVTVYPFVPAYALTICKVQGHTLPYVILWMDVDCVPPGTGYVALSRV